MKPRDKDYLIAEGQKLFPGTHIEVVYWAEVIFMIVDGVQYIFEIGSDDDEYRFINDSNGQFFIIALMEVQDD